MRKQRLLKVFDCLLIGTCILITLAMAYGMLMALVVTYFDGLSR